MRPESGAAEWLAGLDPVGWRFGLERITALCERLGRPQDAYVTAHVVGTNGKSSVTAMTAALCEAHGMRSGAYLSPHSARWSERIRIGGAEVAPDAFDEAAHRVRGAIAELEAELDIRDRVTQFEAATAVAFVAFADAGVELAVIEAGLGGRLDATNVLRSRLTVLTSVGLDHTALLGETKLEIAAEKLAVLREESVLVVGELSADVLALARRVAVERKARLIEAGAPPESLAPGLTAPYLRRNLGVALATAQELCGEIDDERIALALARVELPGRLEWIGSDPPLILDAAHNPDGAAALAEALPGLTEGRPVIALLAMMADKDAASFLGRLEDAVSLAVCTEVPPERLAGAGRPGTASLGADELAQLCAQAGVESVALPEPAAAAAHALELAGERGGVAIATGSHYLLGYAWTAKHAKSSSR